MLTAFCRDRSGNFSVITAFIMTPLVAMAGLAVDVGHALMVRTHLQGAADAAALGAISESSPGVAKALSMAVDGVIPLGQDDAIKIFRSQLSSGGDYSLQAVDAKLTKVGRHLTAEVTYKASAPTTLLRVLGKKAFTLSGKAIAEYDTQAFRDFYVLVDNTPSMGVGATTDDITKMVANTSDKCAFACHIVDKGVENKNDYFNLAKKLGVTIRIDVVAKATAALMDTATATRSSSNQYRMAIYTFGEKAEDTKLQEVTPPTMDLTQAKQKAAQIQLMTIPYQGYNNDQQTSFDHTLDEIKTKIGKQGSGSSTADPEKILFFVSDGVADHYKPSSCKKKATSGRCQEPIDVDYCEGLKKNNIKIAVLYTTYLPLPTNSWYNTWIAPFQDQIGKNMKNCATDGLFFEVSPSQGISEAMNALFMRVVNTPRLTG